MSQSKSRMVHSLRVLGASALAVLALGAVAASAAQAEGKFIAGKYPASLTGTGTGTHTYTFGGVRQASCNSSEFVGELTAASEAVQVEPGYSLCYSNFATQPVTLFAAGCKYGWSVTKLTSPTTATGTGSMICPGANQYRINTYENAKKYSEGVTLCEYGIPSQEGAATIGYEDLGSGSTASVGLSINLSGLTANVFKGAKLGCGAKAGETTTVQYTGSVNLTAKNGGVQTGLSIG